MLTGTQVAANPIIASEMAASLVAAGLDQLAATATVANTTTETVIATMTIPAGQAAAGSMWRINARGIAGVTGTPTVTFRARLGGVAGTAIASSGTVTASSGVTNKPWECDLTLACLTTGASGTSRGVMCVRESISVAGSAPSTVVNRMDGTASVAFDTTIARDLVITAQWSAPSASNNLICYIPICEQVA